MKTSDIQYDTLRDEQYNDYINRLYELYDSSKTPMSITFQVTDDCCLRCKYCYQHNKGHHKMSFDTAKKAIDDILNAKDCVKNYINSNERIGVVLDFIGGEPLMEIDLIDKITDYFISEAIRLRHPWATNYRISICSNGVLYFQPKVLEYIKKNFRELSFSISIDGNKELHDSCRVFPDGSGSYDIAMKAVNHYRNYFGGKMGSKMTIAPSNVHYVSNAVKSLIENGYTHINLNCVYEEGWETYHATELYHQLKDLSDYLIENNLEDKIYLSILERSPGTKAKYQDNWCGGNGRMLAVNWKGNYYPCLRFMEDSITDKQKPFTIGTIDSGIGNDVESIHRLDLLKELTYDSQSTQKCIDCKISQGCGWCTAYNYEKYGTPNKRATFICEMHQAEVLASLYFHNKIYLKHNNAEREPINIPDEWAIKIIGEKELNIIKEIGYNGSYNCGKIQ